MLVARPASGTSACFRRRPLTSSINWKKWWNTGIFNQVPNETLGSWGDASKQTMQFLSRGDYYIATDYEIIYNGYIHIQQHFDFCSHSYKFASGDVLLEGGKPNPDAYILCDGSVEILKAGRMAGSDGFNAFCLSRLVTDFYGFLLTFWMMFQKSIDFEMIWLEVGLVNLYLHKTWPGWKRDASNRSHQDWRCRSLRGVQRFGTLAFSQGHCARNI